MASVVVVGLNFYYIWFAMAPIQSMPVQQEFTLATFNVSAWSRNRSRVPRFIDSQDADVVFLTEVTPFWRDNLEQTKGRYPFVVDSSARGAFGFALLSRFPIREWQIVSLDPGQLPILRATLSISQYEMEIVGLHLYSPIRESMLRFRDRQLDSLGALLENDLSGRRIVVGDLNVTAYSDRFREFVERADLNHRLPSWSMTGTWPAWYRLARIQIDHCLGNSKLVLMDRVVGSRYSSDHLPLHCRFGIVE